MASFLTSTSLLESIKVRGLIPTSQNTFTDQELLNLANEEMFIGLIPNVMQFHEEYLVRAVDIPLNGRDRFSIPSRAIGNKLRDIFFVDTNNNVYEMSRINVADLPSFQSRYLNNRQLYFYVQNDEIVLVPGNTVTGTGALRMLYYIRPNSLVLENRVAKITAVDPLTNSVTVDKLPQAFANTASYDLLSGSSPFKHRAIDVTLSSINVSAKTVVLTEPIPSELKAGDYLCLAEECFIPQIPLELHSVLSQRVMARCMEALGDSQALQNANAKLQEMEIKAGNLIDNRVEGAVMKIFNKSSPLRQANFFQRRRSRF